ncbi:MAG: hypothetical protein V2B19_28995 [Pseudomonadota bacterium]
MEPVATKIIEFGKNMEIKEHLPPEKKRKEKKSDADLSKDFEEAIAIIGLDQPAFTFSEDYDWMVETTRQILLRNGIEYFRGNVLTLMKAWNDYGKS